MRTVERRMRRLAVSRRAIERGAVKQATISQSAIKRRMVRLWTFIGSSRRWSAIIGASIKSRRRTFITWARTVKLRVPIGAPTLERRRRTVIWTKIVNRKMTAIVARVTAVVTVEARVPAKVKVTVIAMRTAGCTAVVVTASHAAWRRWRITAHRRPGAVAVRKKAGVDLEPALVIAVAIVLVLPAVMGAVLTAEAPTLHAARRLGHWDNRHLPLDGASINHALDMLTKVKSLSHIRISNIAL